MSFQSVEQGIVAIQAGNRDEGIRLLKAALQDPQLSGALRAVACLWLAETSADPQQKRAYYSDAMAADPNNPEVRGRAETFFASQYMPPAPTRSASTMPAVNAAPSGLAKTGSPGQVIQSASSAVGSQLAGIMGGPNGPGTAFFVMREGLLATTRYVVGGVDRVTVQWQSGQQIPGVVVRSFPEYDLALIYVERKVADLMPFSRTGLIAEDMPLTAISYTGSAVKGRRRASKRVISPQWIPTNIVNLPDAGGCPVVDDQQAVVGMITRNTSSTSGHVFALHINAILELVESFRQEAQQGSGVYCPCCGHYSRALMAGGYYCEACGAMAVQAESMARYPQPQTQGFYQERSRGACPHCKATVGFHNNMCLRCGQGVT